MPGSSYPLELSDQEWAVLASPLPPAKPGGRQRRINLRVILDDIFYVLRALLPDGTEGWWQEVCGREQQPGPSYSAAEERQGIRYPPPSPVVSSRAGPGTSGQKNK